MTIAPISDDATSPCRIPDVTGLSFFEAACAYAQNGFYVLPVKAGKHPGSIVGKDWPNKSTADLDVIESYWDRYPNAGIAIHTGKSGIIAFDLDADSIHDELAWLRSGLWQSSRSGDSERGHYVFATDENFVCGNFNLKAGAVVGDIRSANSVILCQPSQHPKADQGGAYVWRGCGPVPALPDAARAYVRSIGTAKACGWSPSVPATDALVAEALEKWNGNEKLKTLNGLVRSIREKGSGTRQATMRALCVAASESRIGYYPFNRAVKQIRSAMLESYAKRGDVGKFDQHEFGRLVANGVGYSFSRRPQEIQDEAKRDYGTDSRDGRNSKNGRTVASGNVVKFPMRTESEDIAKSANDAETDQTESKASATVCLADVAPTTVRWLWKGWLPLGKVSILEGESDVGKSTVTLNWASTVSNGARWPDTIIGGKTLVSKHEPADVVLVGIEDSNDDTVVPRLIAAGADLKRVHALNRPTDDNGNPKSFTIPDDIDWLRKAIVETGAKLVIIDPITACLPDNTKHGVDSDIRRILMHVVDLARETDSAIVLIRHFNKAAGMSAKNRGGGSVAYSALVRSVLSVGALTDEHDNGATCGIARAIGNLSKAPESIGYRVESAPRSVQLPKPEDDELSVSVVKWCGSIGINADQLVGADGAKVSDARKTAPVRDDAEAAIRQLLAGGPMKADETLAEAARIASCSTGTVRQAAKRIEVVKQSVYNDSGKIDHWTWELPPTVIKMKPAKSKTTGNDDD